jgi:type IV fimbrial biogenesis protein FimT
VRHENCSIGGSACVVRAGGKARHASGFSLIEMLTTLSILAILLAIASPGLASLSSANALSSVQSELAASLMLARGEAMKRSATVGLAAIAPVTGSEFSAGWTVFVDSNGNGRYDVGETIVRQEPAQHGDIVVGLSANATAITFNSRGFLTPSTLMTFTLCSPLATKGYIVRVEPVGLADVSDSAGCP